MVPPSSLKSWPIFGAAPITFKVNNNDYQSNILQNSSLVKLDTYFEVLLTDVHHLTKEPIGWLRQTII